MKLQLKYLSGLVLALLLGSALYGQPTDNAKREKIEALRVSYITQHVDFTTQEAQTFWPLYNEMNDKLEANRQGFKKKYNKDTNYNFATDKEAEDYLNAELSMKQKEIEIFKSYYDRFRKMLPIKKVAALRRAEDQFRREIIKSIKEKEAGATPN